MEWFKFGNLINVGRGVTNKATTRWPFLRYRGDCDISYYNVLGCGESFHVQRSTRNLGEIL
jgi:hypothetical protein